jgi:hypothetical protein
MLATKPPRGKRAPVAVLLVALSGCGGGAAPASAEGGGGPAITGPAATFVDDLADQICAAAAQCCSTAGHTAPSDCVLRARGQLHESADPKIAAGAALSRQAADECIAAYRDLAPSCPLTWSPSDACHDALVGTSPPGGPCEPGCAPSSEGDVVCAFSVTLGGDAGEVRTPSICQVEVPSPPGGACDTEVTKSTVRVCDMEGGSWCFGGTCSVPVAMGGSCHGDDCVSGTYCKAGSCQPKVALGAPCSGPIGECIPPASCDPGTMVCTAADRWKKLCGGDFD